MLKLYFKMAIALLLGNALAAAVGSVFFSIDMSAPSSDPHLLNLTVNLFPWVYFLSLPVMLVCFLPSALFVERRYATRSAAGVIAKASVAAAVGALAAAILLPLLNIDRLWSLALGAIWAVCGAGFWLAIVPKSHQENSNG